MHELIDVASFHSDPKISIRFNCFDVDVINGRLELQFVAITVFNIFFLSVFVPKPVNFNSFFMPIYH